MKRLRKFTFPLFFLILFILGVIIVKIKFHVPGEFGQWDPVTIQDKMEINGFVTRYGDMDIYAMIREEDAWYIGGVDGLFIENRKDGTLRQSQGMRYVFALMRKGDELLVGYDGGVAAYKNGKLVSKNIFREEQVRSICETEEGVWYGSTKGVYCSDGRYFTKEDGLAEDMVNVMMESSDGSLWFGSYAAPRGGVSVKQKDTITAFADVAHPDITVLMEIAPEVVLTGGGFYNKGGANLFIKKSGEWKMVQTITKKDGLPGEKVRALYLDEKGRLWIGSEYDGVGIYNFKIKEDSLKLDPIFIIREHHGLPCGEIKFIQEDETYYYLGTQQGLSQITKADLESLIK